MNDFEIIFNLMPKELIENDINLAGVIAFKLLMISNNIIPGCLLFPPIYDNMNINPLIDKIMMLKIPGVCFGFV